MSKHYDVVVLGAGVGALVAAALLARRSWRVLVLGQGHRPARYVFDGLPLARRPFTLLAGASPAFGRVLVELAQSQTFRRRMHAVDPMLQVMMPDRRIEMPPANDLFAREIDREFPEVRRVVDELYADLAQTNAAADAVFERDIVWPPGGFWERRETARALARLPHLAAAEGRRELLAEFPREHPFRTVVDVTARFSADRAGELSSFSVARLHGAWTRGLSCLLGGEDELADFLVDRIKAHGGEVMLSERAEKIVVRGGRASGVVQFGEDSTAGVQFVVTDDTATSLLELAQSWDPPRRALASLPIVRAASRRFVVSMLVRDEGLPTALGQESFIVASPQSLDGAIHLQRTAPRDAPAGTSLLVAETILGAETPRDLDEALETARAGVMKTLERFLPFYERHLLVADSPHDGLPLWDHRGGKRELVDRALLRRAGASPDPEPMQPVYAIEPDSLDGLAGEMLRGPLGNTFLVGKSVMPALGQEGELLAAWSVARIITRTDRKKERMRREMWSKVELG
ncbi:MAG TPA: NAD(P)-binding protein [Polyangiaceae bacterium]|jgi:phytoene dehydrogenase-like protein